MPAYDAVQEDRRNRKMMKTGIRAAFSGGIGLAIFLMQAIFGGMAPDERMNILINDVCLMLMAYAAVIFTVFIARREWLLRVNMLMLYLVMPCIVAKLLMTYL